MSFISVFTVLSAILGLVRADGIYTKNSPVLQVNARSYDGLIAQSNHTSILEFYAPWCGHCQNLKPAYEKAAKNLAGLAKVAAINCDEDSNKAFCGQMGVQGFPTLKIVKPGPKAGRPIVEDYKGARTAKAIVDAVVEKIPNHVKRIHDSGLEEWLSTNADIPKAILFTEKGTVSALIRSLAVDFLGSINFGQVRNKEAATVEKFGVTSFPSLVLLAGGSQDPIAYSGEMKRAPLIEFLAQVAAPNPDPPAKQKKESKKSKPGAGSSAKPSSASPKAPKTSPVEFEDFQEIVLDDDTPLESPIPIVNAEATPIPVPEAIPPIETLSTPAELEALCLTFKSGTCILVLLPAGSGKDSVLPDSAANALTNFAELADKHRKRNAKLFPFYSVPTENEAAATIRNSLGLKQATELEIVVLNMKRGWWRLFSAEETDIANLEAFVDGIKLGEGVKMSLPEGFFAGDASSQAPAPQPESAAEPVTEEIPLPAEPEPEAEPVLDHDEL